MAAVKVNVRDVIFTFENSCNSDCFKWMGCCCKGEIEDSDPVFVTPSGKVRRFEYKSSESQSQAKLNLINIRTRLEELAEDRNKLQAIAVALEHQLNLNILEVAPVIVCAAEVKKIEEIALPILRNPTPKIGDVPQLTPKRMTRSPKLENLRIEKNRSDLTASEDVEFLYNK